MLAAGLLESGRGEAPAIHKPARFSVPFAGLVTFLAGVLAFVVWTGVTPFFTRQHDVLLPVVTTNASTSLAVAVSDDDDKPLVQECQSQCWRLVHQGVLRNATEQVQKLHTCLCNFGCGEKDVVFARLYAIVESICREYYGN